jgi:hypothetical protein
VLNYSEGIAYEETIELLALYECCLYVSTLKLNLYLLCLTFDAYHFKANLNLKMFVEKY